MVHQLLNSIFINADRIRFEIIQPDPIPVKSAGICDKFRGKFALPELPEHLLVFRVEAEHKGVNKLEQGSIVLARLKRIADMRRMVNHFPQKISAEFLIIAGEHQSFVPDFIHGRAVHAYIIQINVDRQKAFELQENPGILGFRNVRVLLQHARFYMVPILGVLCENLIEAGFYRFEAVVLQNTEPIRSERGKQLDGRRFWLCLHRL
ncbi:hypothetical protein P4H65_24865 [Paenibacillus chitinolyticus]|uniref:hypothetical protein n=1 Tax=Paenibacillus chitinolyticus TaxID=79263 RepID=UPI002DB62470|nr:hypothetical protein [Paenibacillus chitinolyticus]MEC0249027.1 hypothetical protein [Paenibacillus chitinolyticus]